MLDEGEPVIVVKNHDSLSVWRILDIYRVARRADDLSRASFWQGDRGLNQRIKEGSLRTYGVHHRMQLVCP